MRGRFPRPEKRPMPAFPTPKNPKKGQVEPRRPAGGATPRPFATNERFEPAPTAGH